MTATASPGFYRQAPRIDAAGREALRRAGRAGLAFRLAEMMASGRIAFEGAQRIYTKLAPLTRGPWHVVDVSTGAVVATYETEIEATRTAFHLNKGTFTCSS